MKYFTLILAILLSLKYVNAFAVKNSCKIITGTIAPLDFNDDCNILNEQPKHFPDVTFFGAPGTCFSGVLTATLGHNNTQIKGMFFSGVTVNGIGLFTAASAIQLNIVKPRNHEIELGQIFTKDAISFVPDPETGRVVVLGEIQAMVEGTKRLKGGQGSFEINGDAFNGAPFVGMLCY